MARIKRRPRVSHPIAELNVTNMIDLGFVLLIIFMTCTVVSQQEQAIQIDLPAQSKKEQKPPDKDTKFVSVSIDNAGAYYLDGANVSWNRLCDRLRDLAQQPKPPVIRIRGDRKIVYEKIIALVDEMEKNGLSRIQFDTQTKD